MLMLSRLRCCVPVKTLCIMMLAVAHCDLRTSMSYSFRIMRHDCTLLAGSEGKSQIQAVSKHEVGSHTSWSKRRTILDGVLRLHGGVNELDLEEDDVPEVGFQLRDSPLHFNISIRLPFPVSVAYLSLNQSCTCIHEATDRK